MYDKTIQYTVVIAPFSVHGNFQGGKWSEWPGKGCTDKAVPSATHGTWDKMMTPGYANIYANMITNRSTLIVHCVTCYSHGDIHWAV